MREQIINAICDHINIGRNLESKIFSDRWFACQALLANGLHDLNTKAGRKAISMIDPTDIQLMNKMSDEVLIVYFETVIRSFYMQR